MSKIYLQPSKFNLIRFDQKASWALPTIIFKQCIQMERRLWKQQEDVVLAELVGTIGYTNWTLISIRLAQRCTDCLRTGKQCRERWFNHLNEEISKMPWAQNQEKIIFDLHEIHGNHWKEITRHLKNRTENDVKNHFYAELRKGIRRINKFMGFKKHPSIIRSIRPSVISAVCEEGKKIHSMVGEEKQNDIQLDINSIIFRFSRNEPNEQETFALYSDDKFKKCAEKFLDRIVQQNAIYLKKKEDKQNEKLKRRSAIVKKQNHDVANIGFDISEYLCLDYPPSPSSIPNQSERLSLSSSSSSEYAESPKISQQQKEEVDEDNL